MNPGKFVVGTAALLACCLTSPVRAQIAGFGPSGANWTLNADTNSQSIPTITNGTLFVASNIDNSTSAFYDTVQYIGNFTASFVFQNLVAGDQEGFVFTLQNQGATAVGPVGGNYLGFVGLTTATGIAFDIATQGGRGPGIGYAPQSVPNGEPTAYTQTGPVNFQGTDPIAANILYTNDVVTVTVTDLVNSNTFTTSFQANLSTAVGANTAYVGITGGGTGVLNLSVSNFVFNSVPPSGTSESGLVGLTNGTLTDVSMVSANDSDGVIAVNPAQPNQLFIAGNTNASFTPGLFSRYSTNSGTNWLTGSLTNIPAGYNPAVAWDGYGNLFLTYADDSTLGTDIAFSTNGGQSFTLLTNLAAGDFVLEQRIAVGSGSGLGSVWAFYHDYSMPNSPLVVQGAAVQGFANFGLFGPPELVPGATNDCGFGDIAVGTSGQVLVAYQNHNNSTGAASIFVSLDPDGLGAQGFKTATLATANGIGGNTHVPAAPDALGLNSSAALAWDTNPSDQHYGRAYLVYTGQGSPTSSDLQIFMITSDNNGTTWTAQNQVNDDFSQNSKFMPRVAMDPTDGAVAVSWYDCRNDLGAVVSKMTNVVMTNVVITDTNTGIMMTNMETLTNVVSVTNTAGTVDKVANDDAEMYVTVSLDGGVSFTTSASMSTNPSESFLALNYEEQSDFGDYNGLAYYGLRYFPVWADNSTDFPSPTNPDGPTNKFDIAFGSGTFTGTSKSSGVTGLSVTVILTNTPNPIGLGSNVNYLVTVSNSGPASAPSTLLTDIISPYLVNIKGIPSTNNDTLTGDTLSWPVGTLAPGGTASILISGRIITLGNLTNTASVVSPKVVNLFTNNSVATLITPDDAPDLVLNMTGSLPIIGLTNPLVQFTMTVTNLQPVTATGVMISNTIATNFAVLGVSVPPGATYTNSQTNYIFQLGTMTNGQVFTVIMTAEGVGAGFATNTAVVSDTYVDPVPTNNSATAVTQISASYVAPVFALGVTGSPTNIGGDQQVVYTFNITNVGTVNSPDVLLTNTLSSNLFYLTSSLPNISTNLNSNFELFDLGPLATNQSTNMTITAAGFAIGQAVNAAVVMDALGEGSVTNLIVTPVIPPVLAISLVGTPGFLAIGQTLTNTLNITNIGAVPAYALTISYTVPTNLVLQSITQLGVSGDLSTNQNTLGCEVHELDPGQVTTLIITTTGFSLGKATNSVSLFANFSTNYSAQQVTAVDAPDMSLTMSGSPSTIPVGQPVTYTLTVKNLGPVTAYGVVVTNALQSDLTLAGVTTTQGTYSNLLNVVYGNIGTMASNQTVTLHVTATGNTAAGPVQNTAYVFANSLPDPNPANNLATVTTTITNAPLPYNLVVVPGATSAFITWNTPYGGTDQVAYGLTTSYGSNSFLNTNLNTRHAVLLTGLQSGSNYFFQARSVTSGLLSTTNGSFTTVSSVILGTSDAAYTGVWTSDTAATRVYPTNVPGANYYYTGGVTGSATATATYVPAIPVAGYYDVYLWYPGRSSVASNTPVVVTGTTNAVFATVNQSVNSGSWQLVAPSVFYTNGATGSVVIYNNSGDPGTVVLANAVRWSYSLAQDVPASGSVPAWWADFYFGGNVSGAADADGDGFSNYAEYVLGTDPTSGASSLQFSATSGPRTGTNTVMFAPYVGGRLYQLLSNTSPSLLTGWQTLTNTPTVTANGTGVFTVKAPAGTAVFYRLSVSLSPSQ